MFDTFKAFWSNKITLVNQTAVPASMHGYGMMATTDEESVVLYEESLANFGAAYAAAQESVRSQGTTIASLQGQLQAMQQYCMAIGQQQPPPIVQQRQHNQRGATRRGGTPPAYQQPTTTSTRPMLPPTPYKQFENWNNCHTHGGDIDDGHTSGSCQKPGYKHNRGATRQNTMNSLTAGLHKTILLLASGRVPPPPPQPRVPSGPPIVQQMSPTQHMAWQQAGGPPLTRPVMPSYPTHGMWHIGQHAGPPPPAAPPVAATPPPQPGTYMTPPYYQYQMPPPF
jgi:hypothetical protein